MHRWSRIVAAAALCALLSAVSLATALGQSSASSAGGQGELALKGTIWVAKAPHRRVTVTTDGDIEVKEGKDIYVRFLDQIDDIFVIEVRWWNVTANINVLEHGILTRVSPNIYRYIEADHHELGFPTVDFPGIVGRGTFEIQGRNRAKLIQVGHLVDGSASGFTTMLERTDQLPQVPIAQTYP
jgi:uncharacterized protein YdeI (BOF family)